ncbi:hypothetical protein PVK06_046967 [Gossypium arboreum]|uniref:Uncharacterized protein n=1 Tax=Gossypium arboreum TaxID=29729 RepID=A0ABR0MCG9_GOSAR|nr:hypothetical protein PVK06_046967 [Gossypium arboreum]
MALQAMCWAVNCLDPTACIKLNPTLSRPEGTFGSNASCKHGVESGSACRKPVRGQGFDTEEWDTRGKEYKVVSDEKSDWCDHGGDSYIDEEAEVAHNGETEVQTEAVISDPDEDTMEKEAEIEEDEAACYQEAEVHIKAVVREPDRGTMEEDVEIEVVVTDADNDMEDPYPIDIIAPSYSKEHVASPVHAHVCSSPVTSTMHHTDCSTVDFYGFKVSAHHKQYLEAIYNIEGPFWKNCIIQSPEWIASLLRLFGNALALSDRP